MYTKQLPSMDKLQELAKLSGPYPISAGKLFLYAKKYGFDKDVTGFLRQFREDEEFESREDFIARCDGLELLISEKLQAPLELIHSPQD